MTVLFEAALFSTKGIFIDKTAINKPVAAGTHMSPVSETLQCWKQTQRCITNPMIPIQRSLMTDLDWIKEPGGEGGRVEDGASLTQHLKRSNASHCV